MTYLIKYNYFHLFKQKLIEWWCAQQLLLSNEAHFR